MRNRSTQVQQLALLLFMLLGGAAAHAALNGTYTINGAAAASANNYTTISAAVSDLMTGVRPDGGPVNGPSVTGPVTLRIVPGSGPYTEQVSFGPIAGTTATNYVRLTGGPSRETIQFTGTTTTDRHVIRLTGTKNIILDSLTLVNNGATYGYGVWITNNSDSNFVKNSIINVNLTSTSANFCGIAISGSTPTTTGNNGDYNTIQGNLVNGGYYGYSSNGTSTTAYSQNNHVIDNEFREFYYYGIRHYEQNGGIIRGNTVHARLLSTTAAYGMYIYYNDNFTIERNRVYDVGTYGIYSYYANYQNGSATTRARIANNMIGGDFSATAGYGIYMSTNCTNVDFFHNTVSVTTGTGRAMYIVSGSGNAITNNVFSHTSGTSGYALYVPSTTYVTSVNYNDYWAPGSSNFVYIGTAYTPGTFVGGGGYNLNSLNVNPNFVNVSSNLHIASGTSLYDAGTNVGVTVDFDNDPRPLLPSVGYDIGADEFLVASNDAGVFALTNPVQPFGGGIQNVDFRIRNYGASTLTSATVGWRVNGVLQTPYAWTGSLAPAATSASFTAGTYNFIPGTSYAIKAWTDNPNGTTDASHSNDTLNVNVCTSISGTFTVGGVGADFPTLNAAVAKLLCGGISGPVTLNLTQGAGPFNEQVIIPPIPGTSATNTVRINGGATRETVQFTGTNTNQRAVIKLDGADHIILDSLTITNTDPTYANGVHLINNADSNVIKNCIITVDQASTSANFAGICITGLSATTAGANGNGNLIQNNVVNGGYYGISMQGLSTSIFDQNNAVIGNTINNTYYYPIRCYSQNGTKVQKNTINFRVNGSTAGYMIYMYYADRFDVSQNNIRRGGAYGIYTYYGNYQGGSSTTRAKIVNNMMGGTWLDTSPYGIYMTTNSVGIDVFHNSVSITSGNGRCLYVTGGSANDIRNNSFSHTGSTTGYAAYISSTAYVSGMNYNNYYCPGSSNFIYVGAAYSTTTYQGGGGFNANSRDGDPNYLDPVNDLHAYAAQLFDGGSLGTGVTVDIDDELRPNIFSTIPDIGADEYLPDTVDIATIVLIDPTNYLCPDSNQIVRAVIHNKGLNTISNIAMTADITGTLTTTLTMTHPGPMPLGAIDTVVLGYINTFPGGTFHFEVYNTVPNDQNPLDDTINATRTINLTPSAPTVTSATICAGDSTDLIATGTGTQHWYDAISGGTHLAAGDTLHTGPLFATTNYYVESRGLAASNLMTTFANNNSCGGGNMFDITAISTVTLDSFDLHLQAPGTTSACSVYYKIGTYAGFELTSGAWTLLGSTNVTSAGVGNPTRAVVGGLTIPAGSTYGIYIFNPNVVYTSLATTYSSPEMVISTGAGLCSLFGGNNVGRTWNGRVYYTAEGCASVRTPVTVTVTPTPLVSLQDTTSCGSAILDAGNPGATYAWSNSATTQTISVTSSGTFQVTVSNGACTATDSAVVTISPNPTVNLGPDQLLCNGAPTTLDAGNPGATYVWTTTATTQTIVVNAPGPYAVQVTNGSGCATADTIVITTLNQPAGNVVADTSGCPTVLFTGSNSGGLPSTQNWTFGDGNTGTGANPSHAYTANGTYTVTFIQQNACGADTVTSTVVINCIVGTTSPNGTTISLYPNPTRGMAALVLDLPAATDATLSLMDLHGKVIMTQSQLFQAGANKVDLDLSRLSAGIYTVQVTTPDLHWQGKLLKE